MQVKFEQAIIPCTVSLGIAATLGSEADGKELYKRADENLYGAKHAGRNRSVG
jgi:diguanylate cyclase (GGDEF)-like protein